MTELYNENLRRNTEIAQQEFKENPSLVDEYVKCLSVIIDLAMTARRNGLLALDDVICGRKLEPLMLGTELEYLMSLVVECADPDTVKSAGWFKYYASGYTGAAALIYQTYLEGVLLIQDGTPMGTFEKPCAGLRRLLLFAPKTIKGKLQTMETESKPPKAPALHAKRRVLWRELNNDRDVSLDWDDRYKLRFLNNLLPAMQTEDIALFNDDRYSYISKSALFSALNPEAAEKLYAALPPQDAAIMYNAYHNRDLHGAIQYQNYEILEEVRELFGRIKMLCDEGRIKIDIPLDVLLKDCPMVEEGE